MSHWDSATAEWYAANYGEYATNRLAIRELALSKDSVIVDVGCGTGAALRHASSQVTDGRLIGIDPVPRMVEIAREKTASHAAAERIIYDVGAAEDLPLDEHLADYLFAFDSFAHWQDKMQGLREVSRVLKSSGRFVVVKDGGLPHESEEQKKFLYALEQSAFKVIQVKDVVDNEISFKMWICCKLST